jgi:hypothetical protein
VGDRAELGNRASWAQVMRAGCAFQAQLEITAENGQHHPAMIILAPRKLTMKKIGVCLILIVCAAFSWGADESDVIMQAQNDASEDVRNFTAFWWGIGGAAVTLAPFFGASLLGDAVPVEARRAIALTAPVLGGASLGLIGFFTGQAEVPNERIAEIQDANDDPGLLSLYETEYRKTLTSLQRRKKGSFALIGSGVSIGAMVIGFLVVYLTK